LFLNVDQILPIKDAEEFSISVASKAQDEIDVQERLKNRHVVRLKFWEQFLNTSNKKTKLFDNNSPSKESWIGKGVGLRGISINLVISSKYCRSEIYINKGDADANKTLFDAFYKLKDEIETTMGENLVWERMDDKVTCRIKCELQGVSYFEEADWNKMNEFMIEKTQKMIKAFKEPIRKLGNI
jgi:hypothetical protein